MLCTTPSTSLTKCATKDQVLPTSEASADDTEIILAIDQLFQRLYIQPALEKVGATVVGPVSSTTEVRNLRPWRCSAVIMASDLADGSSLHLARELRDSGIAHLVLVGAPSNDEWTSGGLPVLREPFTAYDVVNWIAQLPRLPT